MTVPRETIGAPKVRPILFRKYLREANSSGLKDTTRRILTAENSIVQPGTFEGVFFDTGRVRRDASRAELRAQCKFESGRVRVVSIYSEVQPGDLFYAKIGRFGSRKNSEQTLEVVRVRVARLQDMTVEDFEREGVRALPAKFSKNVLGDHGDRLRQTFARLWNELGGSWQANPWVWVYEYRTHAQNVDAFLQG